MFHVKRLKVSYKKILKVRESIMDIKNAKEWLLDILKQYRDCNLLSKEVDKLINEIVIKRVEKCKEQDFENMIQTLPKSHKKHILNVLNDEYYYFNKHVLQEYRESGERAFKDLWLLLKETN